MYWLKKAREKMPKKGPANPGPGRMPSGGPHKSVGFVKPGGNTQPTNRSLGFKHIKTCVDKKGL